MSTPVALGASVVRVEGLTHPARDHEYKWFGFKIGGYFFRLVDGDRYLAVLKNAHAELLVDAIQIEATGSDPRPAIKRLATDWVSKRGLARHGR